MKPNILIVEDEVNTREGLRAGLENHYQIELVETGEEAVNYLEKNECDLVLTDLRMPGMTGLELLQNIRNNWPEIPVILLTAYGTVETAVTAMKSGAFDYVSKPVNLDELELVIERALSQAQLKKENAYLKRQIKPGIQFANMTGSSPVMREVFERIRQVASSTISVLIEGKSGTGKELVARAIHATSDRREKAFIAVNCAALSESLLESELFGHEKGAFTGANDQKKGRFELADGGTIFLDEIGEIDPKIQVKLLRVLEERTFERVGGVKTIEVDVRLICATNAELHDAVSQGRFREDLYFRINGVKIALPELRERREDIPLLAETFLSDFSELRGRKNMKISKEVMQVFLTYSWPGNIRELRNCIESMVLLSKTSELTLATLPEHMQKNIRNNSGDSKKYPDTFNLMQLEKHMIRQALDTTDQNRTKAATLLGLSRRTLHRKLHEYGIE